MMGRLIRDDNGWVEIDWDYVPPHVPPAGVTWRQFENAAEAGDHLMAEYDRIRAERGQPSEWLLDLHDLDELLYNLHGRETEAGYEIIDVDDQNLLQRIHRSRLPRELQVPNRAYQE